MVTSTANAVTKLDCSRENSNYQGWKTGGGIAGLNQSPSREYRITS